MKSNIYKPQNVKNLFINNSFFLLLIILISFNYSKAQNISYEWAKSSGGSTYDQSNSVIVDKSGNVYTTGLFMDKSDFNPDPKDTFYLTSNGGTDIYILKLDASGKFVWALNIGGTSDDAGNSINLDASGDVYVTGYFQDKTDFDPGKNTKILTSNGGMDIFVCKFDASGNFVWADQMGGKDDDAGNGIDLDASGNVYTTGYFTSKADFNPSVKDSLMLTSIGQMDIFVSRLDNKGNYNWAGQMGGKSDDVGYGIALDSIGYVFTTGYFMSQADFDPDPKATAFLSSINDADIFVSKLDVKGVYSWARPAGESGSDVGTGIAVDALGNNYTTGYFYGGPDFDPGTGKGQVYKLTSNGDYDIFVWKLDASGAFVWAKNMGGTDYDMGLSIALDANKNVYTTGIFSDVADFDPGSSTTAFTSAGSWDVFISKLDGSGNYDIAYTVGDTGIDMGLGITVDKLKSLYTTGLYLSSVDFDPGASKAYLTSVGDEDAFTLKLSVCKASFKDISVSACNSYNYRGNTYYQSGDYATTLKNSVGCDSIVTLKLKLNTSTVGSLYIGACDSYTLNGQTYTAEGTYNQTLTNKAGCDSFLILELKFLTSSGSVTAKACNTYSLNGKTYNSTGKYTQVIQNKAGCDSTITLNLTVLKSTSSNLNVTSCESYKLFGTTYTKSGIYNQIEKNEAGCDSNITLNLTINNSTFETINKDACSSFSLNAQTYTKSGTYTQVIPNKKGCDSTITLNLSINNSASSITAAGCQSYKLNNQTYTESGVYTQTIPNTKGCDSSITLNLTMTKVITTVTKIGNVLSSDAVGVAYQWVNCNNNNAPVPGEIYQSFTPSVTGDYAVKVTKNTCTDISGCYNVKVGRVNEYSSNRIHLFPNPTNGETNILLANGLNNGIIKLIDITGQIISEQRNLTGNNFIINLSEQSKGIYFIEINQGGNTSRVKLIRN